MAIESEQLADIFRQIREQFTSHNRISVTPVKGDPPHHYEIIYTIPGMTLVNGEKTQGTHHIIELSIPIGFPHFPPSCKPKSDIFHPDFDQAAICLGDFWEQNQSLPELIIHIGRMITGEFYSTENAFNAQAAIWYTRHQERIPFSTVLTPVATPNINVDNQIEIDTLDDYDFTTDYDGFSLDEQSTTEQSSLELDLSLLQHLDKQKKYLELLETVKELPSPTKDVERFSLRAQNAVNKAEKYNKTARQNEQKNNSGLALEGYEKVASLVSDFPNISAKINRVKKSLDLYNDIPPKIVPPPDPQTNSSKKVDDLIFSQKQKKHIAGNSPNSFVSVPALPLYKRKKLILFILLFITLHAGAVGIFFYVEAQKEKLTSAEHAYSQCLAQLDKDNFSSAKDSCEIAFQLSKKVEYLQQQGTSGLTSKSQAILHSEKLQQGLVGKLLIDGQYLTKAEAETALQFNKLSTEGTDLFEQSQWSTAFKKLQEALDIAQNNPFINANTTPDLILRLQHAKLQTLLQSAAEKESQKAWKEAIKRSTDTLAYLNELPSEVQQQYRAQLEQNIAKSRFEDLKIEADQLFAESDWQNATSLYQRLLTLGKTSNIASQETLTEVSKNIIRANLYHAVNSGNMAYSSGSWDEAILAYKSGQSLLADSKDLLTLTDSDVTIRKLENIILQTTIIKNRQTAKKFIEENNLSGAKISHEKIIQSIRASSFTDNSYFLKITAESTEAIQLLEKEIYINEKRHYLEANYQSLFTTNYSATSAENLSHLVVTLIEESSEKFLFKLQCTETNRGSRFLLIIYYEYNKKSGTWTFSSGSL